MKLHEVTRDMMEVATIEDMPEEAIADTLESIQGDFDNKAKSIAKVSINMNSDIAAIDAEIDRLNTRKRTIINRDKSLREYLKLNMVATGIKKISCDLFTITLASGRDTLSVADENMIPDEYMSVKTDVKPDKRKILSDMKNGEIVPGCTIVQSEPSVRIK